MSQLETKTIIGGLKGLLAAAAAGAALAAVATPASAAAIFLDKAEMFHPTTIRLSGPGYSAVTAYAGPVLFTANYGTAASASTFQFLGFCVDVFDEISVGINSPLTINLADHDGPLVNNGQHSPYPSSDLVTFNQTQKDNIGKLVTFGTGLWNADAIGDPSHNLSSTLANQLGAVQGAIWRLENPTFSITGSSAVNGLMSQYTDQSFLNGLPAGTIDVVYSSGSPIHQSFAFAVPEPATWALMIGGFGAMGAMLRRKRQVLALA